jgi:hypothetical protein
MDFHELSGNCDQRLEILTERIKPLIKSHVKKGLVFDSGGEGKNICQTRLKHVNAFVNAFQKMHEKKIQRLPKYKQKWIGWI